MFPSLLPFEKLQVTIIVLVCYVAAIISTVVVQERLPSAPQHQHAVGLHLDDALRDLQAIAQFPHPFDSPKNDEVGDFVNQRLKSIRNDKSWITIDVDKHNNASWYPTPGTVTYMESRNIAIKFEGSKWNESAVLFTAHYDTSSLAPGATDDTIAVVSLLQMADYLAANQPERSVIILFDDGEEDGLHGARMFLHHPWSKLVQSFVNAEGAGAGGRPNLFRSSSPEITSAFGSAPHPHGSSLFSDAFKLGLVRSRTDYDVYTAAGLPGVDYAFYTGRQKYHTMEDTVTNIRDRRPLWLMMENLNSLVKSLAYRSDSQATDKSGFVYFDVFGEAQFYLRFDLYIVLNILLIALGPIIVVLLGYSLYRSHKIHSGWRGWGRFPLALVLGIAMGVLSTGWYSEYNPMIIYGHSYSVITSIICLVTIGALFPLWIAHWWSPVPIQRGQTLVEMFAFWWLIAIVNLISAARQEITGGFFITFFYAATLAATIITLLDQHRLNKQVDAAPTLFAEDDLIRPSGSRRSSNHHNGSIRGIESASERTPLIPRAEDLVAPRKLEEETLGWIWVVEFLVAAVFPVILILQIMWAILAALGPTVVDGSKPVFVYMFLSITALLFALPVAPFAHKLPVTFFIVLAVVGLATAAYNTFEFPFAQGGAYKVVFWQSADLQAGNSTVSLTGVGPYLKQALRDVSPVEYDDVTWEKGPVSGVSTAKFPALAPRSVPTLNMAKWMNIEVEKTGISSALIRISGQETRACRLSFEGGYNVSQVLVRGSNRDGYELPSPVPVKHVNLWKRTWNATWEVEVELTATGSSNVPLHQTAEVLRGKASCIWADRNDGRIPALDQLYVFLPPWATMTAWGSGLVEGWKDFTI
ncbi:hypothetical protein M408DRAFT_218052 [Serendipita vermifera MAFF 305830]|uniref:Peptide hydrolase n=1 Tax=Serendipita vermifera MAFF 305830 TaxID=933852 RepID=A0A0C2X2A1_SERVB|nr:hypothetical protein M408DRAFT_218052 [Serendipita vermifera MAFF 305830]